MNLGNAWYDKAIGEVQVAIYGAVVLGILDGPDTLAAVFVLLLGTEIVVQVYLKTIAIVKRGVGVFNNLL